MALPRMHGRLALLAVLAAVIGVAAGGVAWLLVHLIGGLTNLALLHRWGWSLPSLSGLDPSPWLPLFAVGGALVVSLLPGGRRPSGVTASPRPWRQC